MEARTIPTYTLEAFSALIEKTPHVLSEHPCLVTGFVEQWPAYTRWRDLDLLAALFGHLPVTAGAPQFTTHKRMPMCQVRTDFATYLEYVRRPEDIDTLFEGCWVKGDAKQLRELDLPLYCGNLQLVRHAREPALEDMTPLVPGALEILNNDIPYYYQSGNHVWLYVSRAGALTPLHQDNNAVIAYLAQLQGNKDAILYHPDDKCHFHNPSVGYLDPLRPDERDFPTWRRARPWRGSIAPGDLLIWGPNWAHHVVTRTDSVTVSLDIVNRMNLAAYASSYDWRFELGSFAKKHAALIRDRVKDEAVLRWLEGDDVGELGRELMVSVLRTALVGSSSGPSRQTRQMFFDALVAAPAEVA